MIWNDVCCLLANESNEVTFNRSRRNKCQTFPVKVPIAPFVRVCCMCLFEQIGVMLCYYLIKASLPSNENFQLVLLSPTLLISHEILLFMFRLAVFLIAFTTTSRTQILNDHTPCAGDNSRAAVLCASPWARIGYMPIALFNPIITDASFYTFESNKVRWGTFNPPIVCCRLFSVNYARLLSLLDSRLTYWFFLFDLLWFWETSLMRSHRYAKRFSWLVFDSC